MKRLIVFALGLLIVASSNTWAADFVWLEGEQPTQQNFQVAPSAWGHKEYLSQESWLNISIPANQVEKQVPVEGIILSYDFQAPSGGSYEVWNRIGYEFVRSPFDWRIDNGQWRTITPEQLTTDLMELQRWNEVAWLHMGEAQLSAGKHTLQIRLPRTRKGANGKEEPQHVLYASDALCLYKGAFRPNGKFKPGEPWQTARDRQAAEQVFTVSDKAAPGERIVTPLGGLWQVARYDEQVVKDRLGPIASVLPADQLHWKAIRTPGDRNVERPEMSYAHRYFYRTRVSVPADLAGRSFFLHFPSTNMIATVFVNGVQCGWNSAPLAAWDCDVTKALKPGQVNEIWVGIKDTYYAIAPSPKEDTRHFFNIPNDMMSSNQGVSMRFDMPVWNQTENGILETPSLVATGAAYTSDVFAMPSVQKKELSLQITVQNPTAAPIDATVRNAVAPLEGGPAALTFQPKSVAIPAGGEQTVTLTQKWPHPKLWWPDEPQQYNVLTRLTAGGRTLDTRTTKFGFRQWTWDGTRFKLNGVPFQGRADGTTAATPQQTVALWRKEGATMMRFWGTGWKGLGMDATLDFMDESGVPVRRSGIFDGEMAAYGLVQDVNGKRVPRKALFDNWRRQVTAMVRDERNHPSVFIWSIENEITYINSINFGTWKVTAPAVSAVAHAVMAQDPTRPVMIDGGRALYDFSLPVNGCHYNDPPWNELPDAAYSMDFLTKRHYHEPWDLKPGVPTFLGEAYYVDGFRAGEFSMFGGEQAFLGRNDARAGVGRIARMMSEGYRWMGLAAFQFLIGNANSDGSYYTAWQPVAVLCRQWDWSFAAGSTVRRTLKVLNDTHYADPITMGWQLMVDGKPVAGEKKVFHVAPGEGQVSEISFKVPDVADGTPAQFVLTCERGGKQVFHDSKAVHIINLSDDPKPALKKDELAVLDPSGKVKARLDERGIPYTSAAAFKDIPATARVVVVGPDALSARAATDNKWLALAARGVRLLVLDQTNPLHYMAVPADLTPTDSTGCVAFAENIQHPIFRGLGQQDFYTWSKDHVVYRNAYRKATHGDISLAECDQELGCSAIAECPVNDGLMMLCQMVVGRKLGYDPVARRLFDNMLAYCAGYKPVRKAAAVVMDPKGPRGRLLADLGLKYDEAPGVLSAITDGRHQIVVFDATAANLKALADNPAKVKAFTDAGGYLFAWGLTPAGLADFDRLVGVRHAIIPFEMQRVTLPAQRSPLLSGITGRDVAMESGQKIFPWRADKYMADDEFTYLVDLTDVAPFCRIPGAKAGDNATARKAAAGWARNIVNGFTSADGWKLIHYLDYAHPRMTLTLPRPETITNFGIVLNQDYCKARKVNLYFDDDPKPLSLATQMSHERQDFTLKPRKASRLTIELADFDKPGKTTGIDNVWITVARSAEWHMKVRPLLNVGGLVNYPMGKGGLLLCQLNIPQRESQPENARKKRNIVAALLRNMGAQFSGAKILVPGEGLTYQPVRLGGHCNQYITGDRGWFDSRHDLRALPTGAVTFAGVRYLIRDFRTSPLPSCVMLSGPGVKGRMPAEVTGLPVSGKADSLFFLHAFKRTRGWQPPRRGEQTPPVLFKYVVHYADGTSLDVPVRYGVGADNWIQKDPHGLKGAVVAWAAPFPNETAAEQAVLYQMQWDNPKPDVAIRSVDMAYDASTKGRYGVPALLAVTMATRVR